MTTFTGPTLLAFIAAHHCVSPAVAPVIVGIAAKESGLRDTAIHDNATGRSYFPDTKTEAARIASALMAVGHDLDLGIAQINVRNLSWTLLTDPFDACRNLAAGAKVLFVRYNGTSPPAVAVAYAAAVTVQIDRVSQTPSTQTTVTADAAINDSPALSQGETSFR